MLDVCARVNQLGALRSPDSWRLVRSRAVERWSQQGLLPIVPRPGRGRGKGRDVLYSDSYVDHVVETAELVRSERSWARAALALFVRRKAIEEHVVRRAYLEELDRLDVILSTSAAAGRRALVEKGEVPPEDATPSEFADLVEPDLARRLGALHFDDPTSRQMAVHLVTEVLLGATVTPTAVAALVESLGVPAEIVRATREEGDFASPLNGATLEAQRRVAAEATLAELRGYVTLTRELQAEMTGIISGLAPGFVDADVIQRMAPRSDASVAVRALVVGAIVRERSR